MGAAALREQFDSFLGGPLDWRARPLPDTVPSGVAGIELPRGGLVEIVGPASSGRTSLLLAILAAAGARQEACALVDAEDAFDPGSAAAAGVRLEGLLWVRCGHNAEHALKAADLLVQGGGFGLAILDLGDTPLEAARRISLTSWFRLRRAVEHTPAVLVTVARRSLAGAGASLVLECGRECAAWSGAGPLGPPAARLLRGLRARATSTHGSRTCSPVFTVAAL
jgi:hypothetical protein